MSTLDYKQYVLLYSKLNMSRTVYFLSAVGNVHHLGCYRYDLCNYSFVYVFGRKERLESTYVSVSLGDLASYILKNDLSQLVLGLCELVKPHLRPEEDECFILDRQLPQHSERTLLHLAVAANLLAVIHCLLRVSPRLIVLAVSHQYCKTSTRGRALTYALRIGNYIDISIWIYTHRLNITSNSTVPTRNTY